jgi:uncharacterized protein
MRLLSCSMKYLPSRMRSPISQRFVIAWTPLERRLKRLTTGTTRHDHTTRKCGRTANGARLLRDYNSRMIVHELTRDECDHMLSRRHLARLACARHNQPYVIPVSFTFDPTARALVGFATVGQKIEWMRDNPKVCVEIDEIIDDIHWTTVVVNGSYEEIDSADGTQLARAQELFQSRHAWWLPATARPTDDAEHAIHVFYRIVIREITGRRTSVTPH